MELAYVLGCVLVKTMAMMGAMKHLALAGDGANRAQIF